MKMVTDLDAMIAYITEHSSPIISKGIKALFHDTLTSITHQGVNLKDVDVLMTDELEQIRTDTGTAVTANPLSILFLQLNASGRADKQLAGFALSKSDPAGKYDEIAQIKNYND